ncbi:hypothetical protein RFI_16714 [Reticulomyxa filosa]|uniref:UDP-glucose 4-epimerase n=1 Tax=Reticulomyxa filosa TaxID=46433 RepID=X6N5B6_RETFI|nr:hypothetical protein RFI_16714 [Reticulomyxa filosa]|eukprot:ETO20502.1 hypothetical protein RFI_16714 [Reticulomyxa filosa]
MTKEAETSKDTTTTSTNKSDKYKTKTILVAGGAGYIGTHIVVELLQAGFSNVVVIDNLCNSSREAIRRVEKITNANVTFYEVDIAKQPEAVNDICTKHRFYCCIHLAGLKAVGEKCPTPIAILPKQFAMHNELARVSQSEQMQQLHLSSTACVYGNAPVPYTEKDPAGHGLNSPYGKTKYFSEEIIRDFGIFFFFKKKKRGNPFLFFIF